MMDNFPFITLLGCWAQRWCLAWPRKKQSRPDRPRPHGPFLLGHYCDTSTSQVQRPARPPGAVGCRPSRPVVSPVRAGAARAPSGVRSCRGHPRVWQQCGGRGQAPALAPTRPPGGIALPGGGAGYGGATRPPSLGRLRQPPSPKAPRAWRPLAARVVPACVAVVSRWEARARAAVASPPTRRWRRRATAYVLWQAWVCTVWPAPQLGRSASTERRRSAWG